MSFAILRHGKISSTSKGAAIAHNHRTFDGDQVNIDGTMKHLNRCFMGEGLADRIAALLPPKMRKDAVVAVEVLLTSGPEFFDEIEKDRTKLASNPTFIQWVKQTLGWAKKEFGSNLVDATLHMDESTPHIHLMAVPLTKDGRLCAKEVMARPELQRRQTEYAAAVSGLGLKRGDPASETKRRHIGLKEKPGSGGQLAQLEAKLAKARADLDRQRRLSKEWSDADLAKVKVLEAKLATALQERNSLEAEAAAMAEEKEALAADLECAKARFAVMAAEYEAHKAQSKDPAALMPGEAQEGRLEAFNLMSVGLRQAAENEACEGSGRTVVAVYGRQVIFGIGQGRRVIHTVPEGQPMPKPQQTEQQKGGISR